MKKMTILFLSSVIALSFSLFSFGCAEHKTMEPMDAKTDAMHKEGSTMGGMQTMEMPGTMKGDKSMGGMQTKDSKKEMQTPMEEKKM